MGAFKCASGRCTMSDGVLTIERSNPETWGRWEVFRTGLTMSWEHQPRRTALSLGRTALLGLVFVGLVVYFSAVFGAEPPFVVGMGVLGVLGLLGPLEMNYRRVLRVRRRIQQKLAGDRRLSYPAQIPLDDITGVSVQSISTGAFLTDGHIVLIEFHESGGTATTYLGFPELMSDQRETECSLFKQNGVPITVTINDE